MKTIVVVGTNHRDQQFTKPAGGNFRIRLELLLEVHPNTRVIFEEWMDKPLCETEGFHLAQSRNLGWESIVTPDEPEYETCNKVPDTDINDYGPIENQIRRESLFLNRIKEIMKQYENGLFICGLSHLHSMSEKLLNEGFEVYPYEWQSHDIRSCPNCATVL